ncbi:uncharacterized protein [Clytia hemisphaerica]|uniref:uncharacterized protein n=1 Tax=Clytia hemisphaerica TaxID=252671 RepID=UPI0034D4CA81
MANQVNTGGIANQTNMAGIMQKVLSLKPLPIDPTRCTLNKSLHQQILNNSQATSERQAKQFNLGNSHCTANPMHAADFVLEREYGDSSLFVQGEHTSVFIPPTFVSKQYKKSSTAILDYDVKKDIDRLLVNLKEHSPTYWLTKELETFMQTQNNDDSIDKKSFGKWILNLQIMYLAISELKTDQGTLPQTTLDIGVFVQGCLAVLSPTSPLGTLLRKNPKNLKKQIKQMIEETPSNDSNLRWLFTLELSEVGEKVEHWLYDQLLPLKDDILQNTVVLSSLIFLTNVQKKMHKETDFLIICWERKLIISIELKRTIADNKVFEQLESNHRVFEERLGDQLVSGWTYFPVVGVEHDNLSVKSQHYITIQTDIKKWLTSIFKRFPTIPAASIPNPLDEAKKLLKILVFAIHVSKKDQTAPITSSTWVEYTSNAIENVSTSHNILFYSNQQMAIMNNDDQRCRRVVISGPFGVGKSVLLKQKAIQLNKRPEYKGKVMIVVDSDYDDNKPMQFHRLEVDLENQHGIFVEALGLKLDQNVHIRFVEMIKKRDVKALFIDEHDVYTQTEELLKEEVMPLVDYLWIVPSTESLSDGIYQELSTDFLVVNLEQNFRNSQQIVKSTKLVAEEKGYEYKEGIVMPLGNFPDGCEPIFVDTFEEAVKEARKRTNEGILVINSPFDTNSYSDVLDRLNENYKEYDITKNDFKEGENPYTFLQEGNILILDEFASSGFDWPTVIVFEQISINITYHDCNYMLRCTTNLIVVKAREDESDSEDTSS